MFIRTSQSFPPMMEVMNIARYGRISIAPDALMSNASRCFRNLGSSVKKVYNAQFIWSASERDQ